MGGRRSGLARAAALLVAGVVAWALTLREAPTRGPETASVRILYTPSPEALHADIETLGQAKRTIDLAAYVLTDRAMMQALIGAAKRGVAVRIYIDRAFTTRGPNKNGEEFADLLATPGITVRYKAREAGMMHLKSYRVDDRILRTGSANFSYSGGRFQDNDVVIIDSPAHAAQFGAVFEKMWARADNEEHRR